MLTSSTGESDEIDGAVDNTDKNFLESRNIALMVRELGIFISTMLIFSGYYDHER